jgi:hypothetical protein
MRAMLTLTLLLSALAGSANAQFDPYANTLTYTQCDPLSCEEYYGWTYSGSVGTNEYGYCKTWPDPLFVNGAVAASNCANPVILDSWVDTYRDTLYDSDFMQIYYVDEVRAFAEAWIDYPFIGIFRYWRMYNYAYCDGAEPTQYIQPPASC